MEVNGPLQLAADAFCSGGMRGVRNGGPTGCTPKTAQPAPVFVHKTLPVGNHAIRAPVDDRDIIHPFDNLAGVPLHDPSDVIFRWTTSPTNINRDASLGGLGGYELGGRWGAPIRRISGFSGFRDLTSRVSIYCSRGCFLDICSVGFRLNVVQLNCKRACNSAIHFLKFIPNGFIQLHPELQNVIRDKENARLISQKLI